MEILAWTAVIIIAIALEAATAQLVSIWFAGGGLAGLIAHFLPAPYWLQVIAAAVATLILLLATRPLVRRFLRGKETRTNADRVVGRTAVVTAPNDNVLAKGRVSVLGSDWTARSRDGGTIPAGAQVRVERIEGVKLIVSPENNT